jgi:hypothetical protein
MLGWLLEMPGWKTSGKSDRDGNASLTAAARGAAGKRGA